jgi:nicotinate-nucleotide adenylyltransferase
MMSRHTTPQPLKDAGVETQTLDSFARLSGPTLIFGGSFDPIHNGHLEAALLAKERSGAQNVVFIPAHQNPLKTNGPVANDAQRIEMVALAIKGKPGLFVSGIECNSEGVNFTVDTLRQIREQAPQLPLKLLLGADQIAGLHRWKEYKELFNLAELWVVGRDAVQAADAIIQCSTLTESERRALVSRFVPFRMEISSTEIRAALSDANQTGLISSVAPAVLGYITEKCLYQSQSGA